MAEKPFSDYAERNGAPILDVLRDEFSGCTAILEIGSGTGQHAARFSRSLPHVRWQTSDLDENHVGIEAWVKHSALENLLPPFSLDVMTADVRTGSFDGAYSSNTAHIMSFDGVRRMFALVGKALVDDGVFCLYGPFRHGGKFNTVSNAAFDERLRVRDPNMGVRELESLDDLGCDNDLARVRLYAMPANNHLAVWRKKGK